MTAAASAPLPADPGSGRGRFPAQRSDGTRRRWFGVLSVLGGLACGAAALVTAWWEISTTGGGGSGTVSFFPADVRCLSRGTSTCPTAAASFASISHGLSLLYLSVAVGVLVAIVLALGAVAYLLPGARGRPTSRSTRVYGAVLAVIAAAVLLALPLATATVQPSTLDTSTGFGSLRCPGGDPTRTFWGQCSDAGFELVWGAGPGWYLSTAGGILLLLGAVAVRPARVDSSASGNIALAPEPVPNVPPPR